MCLVLEVMRLVLLCRLLLRCPLLMLKLLLGEVLGLSLRREAIALHLGIGLARSLGYRELLAVIGMG